MDTELDGLPVTVGMQMFRKSSPFEFQCEFAGRLLKLPHDGLLVAIGMQISNNVMEPPICVSCNQFVAVLIEVPLDRLLVGVDNTFRW
jgi:hypothetical protein